jgi:virginiamycin B lyase
VQQAVEESGDSVWLPTADPSLLRVDARTGEVLWTACLPATPFPEGVVGAVGDTAYVLADEAQPTIFVVSGGKVVDRIAAPELAVGVRAGYGALWVPTDEGTVERYDLADGGWTSIATGPGSRFLDVGFGAVWVMNQSDGSVSRIDARTLEAELLPGSQYYVRGGDLTTGAGAVWLRTDDSVLRIDPRSREVTHLLELPVGSGSVAATADVLWITNHDHLAVHAVPLPLPD